MRELVHNQRSAAESPVLLAASNPTIYRAWLALHHASECCRSPAALPQVR